MNTAHVYTMWAPFYALVWEQFFWKPRRRSSELLVLQPGEHLLIAGVGTRQDFPHLPHDLQATGIELNEKTLTSVLPCRTSLCLLTWNP